MFAETPRRRLRVYCAGTLFTEAEREWNLKVAEKLEARGYEVFLPQRDAPQVDMMQPDWQRATFDGDVKGLRSCDLIFANLNGPMGDDGTAFECGMAYAQGQPIVAYRDDWRQAGDDGRGNLMLTRSAKIVTQSADEALDYLQENYPPIQ